MLLFSNYEYSREDYNTFCARNDINLSCNNKFYSSMTCLYTHCYKYNDITIITSHPSISPTLAPSSPSLMPTHSPSNIPTNLPSHIPTKKPTKGPVLPTNIPTKHPTIITISGSLFLVEADKRWSGNVIGTYQKDSLNACAYVAYNTEKYNICFFILLHF